jgi:hypothetical protein
VLSVHGGGPVTRRFFHSPRSEVRRSRQPSRPRPPRQATTHEAFPATQPAYDHLRSLGTQPCIHPCLLQALSDPPASCVLDNLVHGLAELE